MDCQTIEGSPTSKIERSNIPKPTWSKMATRVNIDWMSIAGVITLSTCECATLRDSRPALWICLEAGRDSMIWQLPNALTQLSQFLSLIGSLLTGKSRRPDLSTALICYLFCLIDLSKLGEIFWVRRKEFSLSENEFSQTENYFSRLRILETVLEWEPLFGW